MCVNIRHYGIRHFGVRHSGKRPLRAFVLNLFAGEDSVLYQFAREDSVLYQFTREDSSIALWLCDSSLIHEPFYRKRTLRVKTVNVEYSQNSENL